MTGKPTVTIAHSLPGRLRVHLSVPPRDTDRFIESVKGHEGLDVVEFTLATRSVLAQFDTKEITQQEVIMRIAMALSLQLNDAPVVVLKSPESEVMTNGAAVTGILTGTTLAVQWFTGAKARSLQKLAAFGTGAVVLQHGWREVRERGYFDPEVISLTYLAASMLRGDYARGALITWIMTFGRHLLASSPEGVEVRPLKQEGEDGATPKYELALAAGPAQEAPLFSVLRSFVRYLGAPGGVGQAGLLEELRDASRAHGEMVEGLGWMRHDIPLHFG